MSLNSRSKGKRGELEISAILRANGFNARRGQQFRGGSDSPDVIGLPGWHIEVKRTEKGNPYDWMAQAEKDAGDNDTPVVMHRRNNQEWIAILKLDHFLTLLDTGSQQEGVKANGR